jgi:phosphoacetylglucosamine mutase
VRVEVADRNIFKAVDAERKLESPPGVQAQIDALVGKYKNGRSFARASGTEDALRVYAEAATRGKRMIWHRRWRDRETSGSLSNWTLGIIGV